MIKIIVGCIIIRDNSFVIVKEAQKHVYGKWNLPLGHLDEGESFSEAIIREAHEEAGLQLDLNDLKVAHIMHIINRFENNNT